MKVGGAEAVRSMVVEYKGSVIVLDDGEHTYDLVGRVEGIFPSVYRMSAHSEGDGALAVGARHVDVKTIVRLMHDKTCYWGLVPANNDPAVTVSDLMTAARTHLASGFPGFVLISGRPGQHYERVAAVADVSTPFTTGALALAAVALAWRTGSTLDVLVLGGDPANPPTTTDEARALFDIDEGAAMLEQAVEAAHSLGITVNWKPLGESTARDQLVLDAVRDGGYDIVVDDLRAIDVGPRIGRLKRVRTQLVDSDSIDTAYRLLRDAPCDVAVVVDAVRMNLIPASYVKAGAVAALSLGVLGAASLPAAASAQAATIEASVDPAAEEHEHEHAEDAAAPAAEAAAPAEAEPVAVGVAAPSTDVIPEEVTEEQLAAVDDAVAEEQSALAAEQEELAGLQQQQAAADQALAQAETDLALEQQDVYDATATVESAESALEYAEGNQDSLTESEEQQALGSLNRAEHDLTEQQEDVAEAQAVVDDVQAQAETAAEAVAQQSSVVAAQQANVDGWGAFAAEAEANAPQIVSPCPGFDVSTHYGESGSNWASGHHTGTDFAAPAGADVVAASDGVVIQAGFNGPYGNQIAVQHSDGTVTTYAHLSEMNVSVGQEVEAGETIGAVGSTGNSTGPHLHFEVYDASGNQLNPEEWLGEAVSH